MFSLSEKPDPTINAMKLGIFGRIIKDDDVHEIALARFPLPSAFGKLKAFYHMFLKVSKHNLVFHSALLRITNAFGHLITSIN